MGDTLSENLSPITPKLDSVDLCMRLDARTERLHEHEYLLLEQLIAYKEQGLSGESLKDVIGLEHDAPDRIVRAVMDSSYKKNKRHLPAFSANQTFERQHLDLYRNPTETKEALAAVSLFAGNLSFTKICQISKVG